MSDRRRLRIVLGSMLLWPAALSPQMPSAPAKLVIMSDPTGATVTINGVQASQHTNATFVVSPGKYGVSVVGPDGKPSCSGITLTATSGHTVGGVCSAAGWTPSA